MGLVQRVLESHGIATVSVSMIADFTAAVGVPRLVAVEHPPSRPMGPPRDADRQRAVLRAAIELLDTAVTPGVRVDLPWTWPESPRAARRAMDVHPPISRLLVRRPWLLPRLISGDVPAPVSVDA